MNRTAKSVSIPSGFEANVKKAQTGFDRDAFRTLITGMVNTPSLSGEEKPLAQFAANFMSAHGLHGEVQEISEKQANALGRLPTKITDGPSLLIYGGIDAHV